MDTSITPLGIIQKTLITFILLSLIAIGIIGVFKLFGSTSDPFALLAALFSFSRERIIVNASPEPAESGQNLHVAWIHEGKSQEGSYQFLYPCKSGISFRTVTSTAIPCNASLPLSLVTAWDVIPVNDTDAPITLSISIQFYPNGEATAGVSGVTTLGVLPVDLGHTPPPSSSATSPAPAPATDSAAKSGVKPGQEKVTRYPVKITSSDQPILPNGKPDLVVTIVNIGTVNEATGAFSATSSVRVAEPGGVVFDISNIGTAVSGTWEFAANLPTDSGLFVSDPQPSLKPGEKIRYTLGFRALAKSGPNTVTITIDPRNAVNDSNRANDFVSTTIFRMD